MALGPVDVAVVAFPGQQIRHEIVPILAQAVGSGTIRIVDLLFVRKAFDGALHTSELNTAEHEIALALDPLTDEVLGLFAEEDVAKLDATLEPDTTVLVIVFEHLWAARLAAATAAAHGRVITQLRIADTSVDAVLRAREAQGERDGQRHGAASVAEQGDR